MKTNKGVIFSAAMALSLIWGQLGGLAAESSSPWWMGGDSESSSRRRTHEDSFKPTVLSAPADQGEAKVRKETSTKPMSTEAQPVVKHPQGSDLFDLFSVKPQTKTVRSSISVIDEPKEEVSEETQWSQPQDSTPWHSRFENPFRNWEWPKLSLSKSPDRPQASASPKEQRNKVQHGGATTFFIPAPSPEPVASQEEQDERSLFDRWKQLNGERWSYNFNKSYKYKEPSLPSKPTVFAVKKISHHEEATRRSQQD